MFNLFKKKEPTIRVINKVWMSESGKWKMFIEEWKKNENTVFVFWFDETLQRAELELSKVTTKAATLFTARELSSAHLTGKEIIFLEHYPLLQKENDLFQKLGLKEATVWSALDEPLFLSFGGERIISLMKKLGMSEEETIEHNMISSSIQKAQEKIAKKITIEQSARSQKEWFQKNTNT